MMQRKTVVVIEDSEVQREALHHALERRDFRAVSAATVDEARRAMEELGEEIDVIVLDMRLEDPSEPAATGADVCIQIQDRHSDWLPEYLINSAIAQVDYYRLAMRLGAAVYLSKTEASMADIIRHVRALALRRALRVERTRVAENLRAISDSTKNLSSSLRKLCREVLASEFDACLGAPYVLLLTDESGTRNFATNTDLSTGYEKIYATLQAMTYGITGFSSVYEVSGREIGGLSPPANPAEVKIYERLPGSAFVPLASIRNIRLSLGLLAPLPGEVKYPEDTAELARVLARYVKTSIVEHLLRILDYLESQKKAAILKSTSRLCLLLGKDQKDIVSQGIRTGHIQEDSNTHHKLDIMADDLWEMGTVLANVTDADFGDEYAHVEIKELVEAAISELNEKMYLRGIRFEVEGSCTVRANRDDMYVAVIRVMQWLAQRKMDTPDGVEPQINVQCLKADGVSQVIFEDRSQRLADKLREQLFMPFSVSLISPAETVLRRPAQYLPLYVAKMLIEEKYGGWLDDRSHEIPGDIGHRLVMRFDASGNDAGASSAADTAYH
jgi:DNA-binding NarL/FixJ family response regulator